MRVCPPINSRVGHLCIYSVFDTYTFLSNLSKVSLYVSLAKNTAVNVFKIYFVTMYILRKLKVNKYVNPTRNSMLKKTNFIHSRILWISCVISLFSSVLIINIKKILLKYKIIHNVTKCKKLFDQIPCTVRCFLNCENPMWIQND